MTEFKQMLIEEVRQNPLLWDTNLRENKDFSAKEKAWIEIGLKLGKQPSQCKSAFELLRQQFSKERRKCQPSEDGSVIGYQGTWTFFESLSFLFPFIIPRKPVEGKSMKPGTSQQYEEIDESMFDSSVDYSNVKPEIEEWMPSSSDRHYEFEPPYKILKVADSLPIHNRPIPLPTSLASFLNIHEIHPKVEPVVEDEYDRFGKMMTKLIRKIEPESRRLRLIIDINALIYSALADDDNC